MTELEFVEPHDPEYRVQEMSSSRHDKWTDLKTFNNPTDAEDYAEKIQEDRNELQIVRVQSFNY